MCTLLKYGVVLPENQRKKTKGWIWDNEGSSENSKNSIPVFWTEIWATDNAKVEFLKNQLKQWQVLFNKVGDSDWGKTQILEEQIEDPKKNEVVKFKMISQIDTVVAVSENDPANKARRMYQVLAMTSEAIKATLDSEYKPSKASFTFTKMTITGFIGATWGGSRMGYCTNDSNNVQFKFSKVFSYDPADGWRCGDWTGQLWFAFAFNSFFQIQITIPLQTLKFWTEQKKIQSSADSTWSVRLHFSLPNGFIKGSKASDFSPSVTAVQAVGTAIMSMINNFYQEWKSVKNAEAAALASKMKTAIFKMLSPDNYKPVAKACEDAKAIAPGKGGDGSIWANIAKAGAAAAVKAALTGVLSAIGLEFGSLTEAGLQGDIYTDPKGKTTFAATADLGTAFFTKLDRVMFVFYVIQGELFEVSKEWEVTPK
jgi:hypothetical protein